MKSTPIAKTERARQETKEAKEEKANGGKEEKADEKQPLTHQEDSKRQETNPERVDHLR